MTEDRLLASAAEVAREAGALLRGWRLRREEVVEKGDIDLVTAADRAAETLIVDRLRSLTPGASILAEEGTGVAADPELRWIVDPLDGTTNFAHGYPVYSVSIALETGREIALGVVYDPSRDEMFTARRGAGAFLNGRPLRVSDQRDLGRSLVATGFPYDSRDTERDNLTQFAAFAKRVQGLRRGGSAALDLSYVACGRFDGYWEEKLAPWDVAAGMLIAAEAGGRLTGYRGEEIDPWAGHLIASNGAIHDAMVSVLEGIERAGGLPPLRPRYPRPA